MRGYFKLLFFIVLPAIMALQACDTNMGSGSSNEAASLRFNLVPGTKYQYTKTSKEVLEPEMKRPSFSITQDRTIESTYDVLNDNGAKKLSFVLNHIIISVGTDNTNFSYDSNDSTKAANEVFKNVPEILHRNYTASIINGNIAPIDKTLADSSATDSTGKQLSGFSNASVSALVNDFFNIFPDKPVKKGDSWQTRSRTTLGFVNVDAITTYKLQSIYKGVANIDINANLASSTSDTANVDMKGVQIGNMTVDVATGMILNCDLKSHINGMIHLSINAPASISSEVNITGKKL